MTAPQLPGAGGYGIIEKERQRTEWNADDADWADFR